jgi:hypothetical protein
MGGDDEEDNKIKMVKVLARAASDQDFYQKLRTDTTKTLNDEGIQGEEFYIPDEKALKAVLRILEALGGIIYKRS